VWPARISVLKIRLHSLRLVRRTLKNIAEPTTRSGRNGVALGDFVDSCFRIRAVAGRVGFDGSGADRENVRAIAYPYWGEDRVVGSGATVWTTELIGSPTDAGVAGRCRDRGAL